MPFSVKEYVYVLYDLNSTGAFKGLFTFFPIIFTHTKKLKHEHINSQTYFQLYANVTSKFISAATFLSVCVALCVHHLCAASAFPKKKGTSVFYYAVCFFFNALLWILVKPQSVRMLPFLISGFDKTVTPKRWLPSIYTNTF